MGGEIYIARQKSNPDSEWDWREIPIDEWRNLMKSTKNIRPNDRTVEARNPYTGEPIKIPPNPDVAEIYDKRNDEWFPLLSWDDGAISFYPPEDPKFFDGPMMDVIHSIAVKLEAIIIDGRSGEIILKKSS